MIKQKEFLIQSLFQEPILLLNRSERNKNAATNKITIYVNILKYLDNQS